MIAECLVVEFRVTDDDCPLARASRSIVGPITAAPPLLRGDDDALLRFTAGDAGASDVLEEDEHISHLHRTEIDNQYTFRCLSTSPCVVHELVDAGFLVESVQYHDGVERHVGAVVGEDVLGDVLDAAGETVGVTLERLSPLGEVCESPVESLWDLTPCQAEALEAAYEMGYFEVPKGTSAGEVADVLEISKSAFLERLRRGQSGIFRRLLS